MKLKKTLFLISILIFQQNYAQLEANNWLFGNNAGLNFGTGNPTPIIGGALTTTEGCSSFSDATGNLLFYTDGITVYNRNHNVMPNGTNLGGNPSSSQSGLIVPNPSNDDLFYLFTVGTEIFLDNAGFKYYTIDMTLSLGNGDVVAGSEVDLSGNLSSQWTEKVTAVQTDNCNEYWVISQDLNNFYTYLISSAGVSATPIVSPGGFINSDVRGYLKVSPDGTKIVSANMNSGTFLYDFDITTGQVSNVQRLNLLGGIGYGVEFSLNSKRLYIATGNWQQGSTENLFQFNLDLPNFNAINSSRQLIHTYTNTRAALQLAANGKIYWASDNSNTISVINNPEDLGTAVNYNHRSVSLGAGTSTQGLPPFIQSLFIGGLEIVIEPDGTVLDTNLNLCIGDTFNLHPDISTFPATTTYEWSLTISGVTTVLPVTSSNLNIDYNGTYSEGEYALTVDFNDGNCSAMVGNATIIYHDNPTINSPITIKQCDDDSDGNSAIDLTILYSEITTNSANETIVFYESQANAISETNPILNDTNYITNTTTIWANVKNLVGCSTIGQIDIIITATSTNFNQSFYKCDDLLDTNGDDNTNNDDTDGIATFNFDISNQIISLFPVALQPSLSVAYYHTINDGLLQQNEITNSTTYRNINSIFYEKIYIRVNSSQNLDCVGFGENLYVELFVEVLPIANTPIIQRHCAVDVNGAFPFNTATIADAVLLGQTGVNLTYFNEDGSQITTFGNDLPNPFLTSSQTIKIVATNNSSNAIDGPCSDETTLEFIADKLPYIDQTPIITPLCDDLPNDTDGMSAFDTSLVEYFLLGGSHSQLDMEVLYYNEDGSQIFNENGMPSPLPDPFVTSSQIITAKVVNPLNLTCYVSTTIDFTVNKKPEFNVFNDILCLNNLPTPLVVNILDVPALETYTYAWFDNDGNNITIDENNLFLELLEAGSYSVIATTTDGNLCSKTKEFIIQESDIANIITLTIFDDLPNNQISILVSGSGEYEFALNDNEFVSGNTPEGHIFYDVTEGLHTIYIRDIYGCGKIKTEVPIIRFPKFITPNGDRINDIWQVKGIEAYPIAAFTIFDRYGKVITQFTNNDIGWDGTFKGKIVKQTDYWYLAIFEDLQGNTVERRGHFSLKM